MKELILKKWRVAEGNSERQDELRQGLHTNDIVARLLYNRNIRTVEEGRSFLYADTEAIQDPFLLKDMRKAVEYIKEILSLKKKIVIYGDYDVDGITATSLLYRFFLRLDAHVEYYIPERQSEGYGLNIEALQHLANTGADLVITVDCGISSSDIVAEMKDILPIIITDHHTPPDEIPPALAVINPKQKDCTYPEKNLAGVGVAFKLCQAIWYQLRGEQYLDDLDIVALGTVADVVPLIGENRIFVRRGLELINTAPKLGIQALIRVAGLSERLITAGHIGYTLAPRLNAAGRVTHATEGVRLLTTSDRLEAEAVAEDLQETNMERQEIERNILEEARQNVLQQGDLAEYILVVAGEQWHQGVIGIVASRLVEEFYKPTLVISINDGVAKGSCRSIDGFDMYDALKYAEDLLIQFGGHKQAAGFSIETQNITALRERLCAYAKMHLTKEDYIPVVDIDLMLEPRDIQIPIVEQLSELEPYGMANSTPVFALENIRISNVFAMGKMKQHLKVVLDLEGEEVDAIYWFGSEYQKIFYPNTYVKLAFTMSINEWNGIKKTQLTIQDMQPMQYSIPMLTEAGLREIYPMIKRIFRNPTVPEYIVVSELIRQCPSGMDPMNFMLALDVFKELGIIIEEQQDRGMVYRWCHVNKKLELITSVTFLKYSS